MSSKPAFSNKRLRDIERIIHIAGGVLLLIFLYNPWDNAVWFTLVLQVVVFPIIVGSGFAMWQLPRARRWWNARRTAKTQELVL